MGSLYDELGADPAADPEQLRLAYRQRAREVHPDVNAGADSAAAMQRLNAAWAVLGDPEARRRYDRELRDAAAVPPAPAAPAPATVWAAPGGTHPTGGGRDAGAGARAPGCLWLLRPSVVVPAVLLVIFVVTAYAGHPGSGGGSAPSPATPAASQPAASQPAASQPAATTTPAVSAPALVGSCLQDQPASVRIVPCWQRPNHLVIAIIPGGGQCPTGSTGYLVEGQAEMLCATAQEP